MITVRTLKEWDLPWCEWTEVYPKDVIGVNRDYEILVGEEYQPAEFKEPHIILLHRDQATKDNPYAGDFCYISVGNDPVILKGYVEDFELIKKWIILNQECILEHWIGGEEYGTVDFYDKMRPLYD